LAISRKKGPQLETRIGINGFGRIGRQVFKAIRERHGDALVVVAINDLVDVETNAHLLKYDSNYGRYPESIEADSGDLVVGDSRVAVTSEADPAKVPWDDAGVEIVVESTPVFTDAKLAGQHRRGSVRKVIITAPAQNEDVTIVLGVNHEMYDPESHNIVSNASCTTNGLAPVVKVLLDDFGLMRGQMTTIHSYTNSQRLLDVAASNLREARAAAQNIVPTSTGAARALKLVLPAVEGKLDGVAYRVPTSTVSIVEVVGLVDRSTDVAAVNGALDAASHGQLEGILAVTDEPLVSSDLKGNPHSSIVDSMVTNVVGGDLVKVAAWYDNEWGYSCRVADLAAFLASDGAWPVVKTGN
jgi:glyceraldehyde 3-phosphate dehydrogenase